MIKQDAFFSNTNDEMTRSDRSLHTPGSFAKQNLLYVQEVGRLQSLKPHRCVREGLSSFLFLVVLEGCGELVIEGHTISVKAGNCALIDCMQHYEHISDESDAWKLAWVHFNGNSAKAYYDLFLKYNAGNNVFAVQEIDGWDRIIGELLEKQNDRSLNAELRCGQILLNLVNNIIEEVAGNIVTAQNSDEKQKYQEMREYLNENYALPDVLKNLCIAYGDKLDSLNNGFYKLFGIRLEEYVSSRRLNAAKELLRFSIKPMEEVAAESGIGDLIALQQIFRDREGMSAEEYRMKWAQWIK